MPYHKIQLISRGILTVSTMPAIIPAMVASVIRREMRG